MIWALVILFAALSLADAVTTTVNMRANYATEGNPAMAWAMRRVGVVTALVITKTVGVVALALAARAYPSTWPGLVVVDLGMTWVVWHNYSIFKDHQR